MSLDDLMSRPPVRRPARRQPALARPAGALAATLVMAGLALAPGRPAAQPASAPAPFSASEQALFLADHLARLQPPASLRYSYVKAGSLEAGFTDSVVLKVRKTAAGVCCDAEADFLTGERRMPLPAVEGVKGNPVLLYFLERDIREMNRLTKGQAAYFRKRIRLAVFDGAEVTDIRISYLGKPVAAQRISIRPYAEDPLRGRFEKLATKQYVFVLSPHVPGELALLRASVAGADASQPPVLSEQLTLEGVVLPPS